VSIPVFFLPRLFAVATCALLLVLAGCGNKGDLYLKSDGSAREQLEQLDNTLRGLDENEAPADEPLDGTDDEENNDKDRRREPSNPAR